MNEETAAELARFARADQDFRGSLPDGPLDPELTMQWARLDVGHTDRLREIIDQYGWPGHRLVGEDGAEHAWLLALHADRQLDFQRQALSLLTDAVQRGDAAVRHLAYLTDRVRVNEGREQVYGTRCAEPPIGGPCRGQLKIPSMTTIGAPPRDLSHWLTIAPSSTTDR